MWTAVQSLSQVAAFQVSTWTQLSPSYSKFSLLFIWSGHHTILRTSGRGDRQESPDWPLQLFTNRPTCSVQIQCVRRGDGLGSPDLSDVIGCL